MKKKLLLGSVLLVLFAIGTLFAEDFQCDDPTSKKVSITFLADYVYVNYQGNKAQSFDVVVKLKDGNRDIVHFNIAAKNANQSRPTQQGKAAGLIDSIYNCDLQPYR